MYDQIIKIGNSTVQHGSNNNRVYLMKLNKRDFPNIIADLFSLANKHAYSKIFAKVPRWAAEAFEGEGFYNEAVIPGFYSGTEDVCFMSFYLTDERKQVSPEDHSIIKNNIDLALSKQNQSSIGNRPPDVIINVLDKTDAKPLTELYKKVFDCYPFPVFEEEYIQATMEENIVYFGAWVNDRLIAASSAEMDIEGKNAEMTDFATDPEFLGQNLSLFLLYQMEKEMRNRDFKTLYTIARSFSAGMNITFAKSSYNFAGTLINNTYISTKIESMNVWYKNIYQQIR